MRLILNDPNIRLLSTPSAGTAVRPDHSARQLAADVVFGTRPGLHFGRAKRCRGQLRGERQSRVAYEAASSCEGDRRRVPAARGAGVGDVEPAAAARGRARRSAGGGPDGAVLWTASAQSRPLLREDDVANPLSVHSSCDADGRVHAIIARGAGTATAAPVTAERCSRHETDETLMQ